MQIADELKTKRDEVAGKIDALRREIASLELQCGAFDVVIRVYDADYRPESAKPLRARKPSKVSASSVTPLLHGIDKRGTLLRMLRDANSPISTSDCARTLAAKIGLPTDDPRVGHLGNVLSRDLERLVRDGRVRYAAAPDSNRRLWEIAA
jgi:hypothetical protein